MASPIVIITAIEFGSGFLVDQHNFIFGTL